MNTDINSSESKNSIEGGSKINYGERVGQEVNNVTNFFVEQVKSITNINEKVFELLKNIEKSEKGFCFNEETVRVIFNKYPLFTIEKFKSYFLGGVYNKNILNCHPEIIEILNLEEIVPGDDLIEYIINKISLSDKDFINFTQGKIDFLTFPNMAKGDVAQGYFYEKLEKLLPGTKIIFGDMPEIKEIFGKNQFNCDSVGFIDLMGNGLFNTCLLKLIKTLPIDSKIKELNEIFSTTDKNIFIGGSTLNIPFKLPNEFKGVALPKGITNSGIKPTLLENGILINSMGYLNSAYYSDKVKGSFVLGSHNIAEPMHAGKLTVINNDLKNRYNHNWLISYFGEKSGLLKYMEGKNDSENQEEIDNFLSLTQEELEKRYKKFQELYERQIIPLINGVFYNFLRKNFPEKIF